MLTSPFATAREHPGGERVHGDADARDHRHGKPGGGGGIGEALRSLEHDRAECDQQQQRVGQRGEDRRALQPVGVALGRCGARKHRAAPGDDETEHVAQIVARVGEQRDRVDPQADDRLDDDEHDIEADADPERAVERGRGVAVAPVRVAPAVAV